MHAVLDGVRAAHLLQHVCEIVRVELAGHGFVRQVLVAIEVGIYGAENRHAWLVLILQSNGVVAQGRRRVEPVLRTVRVGRCAWKVKEQFAQRRNIRGEHDEMRLVVVGGGDFRIGGTRNNKPRDKRRGRWRCAGGDDDWIILHFTVQGWTGGGEPSRAADPESSEGGADRCQRGDRNLQLIRASEKWKRVCHIIQRIRQRPFPPAVLRPVHPGVQPAGLIDHDAQRHDGILRPQRRTADAIIGFAGRKCGGRVNAIRLDVAGRAKP